MSTIVDVMSPAVTATAESDGDRQPIARLREIRASKQELAREEAEQVRKARLQGHSWHAIADALDISRQAAHKRFGKR